jgi:hypothetical protein
MTSRARDDDAPAPAGLVYVPWAPARTGRSWGGVRLVCQAVALVTSGVAVANVLLRGSPVASLTALIAAAVLYFLALWLLPEPIAEDGADDSSLPGDWVSSD